MKNNNIPRWDDIKRKVWLKNEYEKAKDKVKCGAKKVGDAAIGVVNWTKENPFAAAMLAAAGAKIISTGARSYSLHAEGLRRERDFYDPRTGRHTITKRNLRPWESEEVDFRYDNGESYVSIFRDMGIKTKN